MMVASRLSVSAIIEVALWSTLAFAQCKIVLTNDDGWATANIRAQDTALTTAGFNVVLSAPANDESGTGSEDFPPTAVGSDGCEFDTCPAGSPPTGFNVSDPRLNYVNSFPVTSVRFGIQTASPPFFGDTGPDFVVSGPNIGNNLGLGALGSGTVGAACEAAKEGVPSVALSGATGSHVSFTTLLTPSDLTTAAEVYGELGARLTQALLGSGISPILPSGITLNVNYPTVNASCPDANSFKFVLTRIFGAIPIITPPDVNTCGRTRLPTETSVVAMSGCFASVSVMDATLKLDVLAPTQQAVLDRLGSFLSCPLIRSSLTEHRGKEYNFEIIPSRYREYI